MQRTHSYFLRTLLFLGLLTFATQGRATVIELYATTFDEGVGNVLDENDNQALRDDSLWQAYTGSGWTHGQGNSWVYNTVTGDGSPPDGPAAEAPFLKVLSLAGKGLTTHDRLNISFNYSAWGAEPGTGQDDLYIHVWGFTDVASTGSTVLADLVSQEGNSWGALTASEYDDMVRYNLRDGSILAAGSSSNGASRALTLENMSLSLTNDGSQANASFQLDATGTLANYDYMVVSFTRNVAGVSGEAFAIRDLLIEAQVIPEPSGLALFGLGVGLLLALRRQR